MDPEFEFEVTLPRRNSRQLLRYDAIDDQSIVEGLSRLRRLWKT